MRKFSCRKTNFRGIAHTRKIAILADSTKIRISARNLGPPFFRTSHHRAVNEHENARRPPQNAISHCNSSPQSSGHGEKTRMRRLFRAFFSLVAEQKTNPIRRHAFRTDAAKTQNCKKKETSEFRNVKVHTGLCPLLGGPTPEVRRPSFHFPVSLGTHIATPTRTLHFVCFSGDANSERKAEPCVCLHLHAVQTNGFC